MARKALIVKTEKPPKFRVRQRNRCFECGRARDYRRKFRLCGRHVRMWVYKGWVYGFGKVS